MSPCVSFHPHVELSSAKSPPQGATKPVNMARNLQAYSPDSIVPVPYRGTPKDGKNNDPLVRTVVKPTILIP